MAEENLSNDETISADAAANSANSRIELRESGDDVFEFDTALGGPVSQTATDVVVSAPDAAGQTQTQTSAPEEELLPPGFKAGIPVRRRHRSRAAKAPAPTSDAPPVPPVFGSPLDAAHEALQNDGEEGAAGNEENTAP